MSKKNRIILISSKGDESGAPRHVEQIIYLLKGKFDFICVFGEDGNVSKRIMDSGIKVYIIKEISNKLNLFNDVISILKLYKLVRRLHPNLIHCHSTKASWIGRIVAKISNIPSIFTVHGWGWRNKGLALPIIIIIEKILYYLTNSFYICVSDFTKRQGIKSLGISESRVVKITNSVELKEFKDLINRRKLRSNNQINILMAARVSDAKDHITLFKAFDLLPKRYKLILCGKNTNSNEFIKEAQIICPNNFHNISFLGERNDIDNLLLNSDIFTLISNYEAMPLSILEAMSFSLPIIASDVGGVRETIYDNYNGYLIPKNDKDILVEKFLELSSKNRRIIFGNRSRNIIAERFDARIKPICGAWSEET